MITRQGSRKSQHHIPDWRCCYLWNEQCDGCDWITQESNAQPQKIFSREFAVCGSSVVVGASLELDPVLNHLQWRCDVMTDNTTFCRHCLWKYFEKLFGQKVNFHIIKQFMPEFCLGLSEGLKVSDMINHYPSMTLKNHPYSTTFQHWQGVFLCLALASFLMVEAAPARAGAMKKGGRLVSLPFCQKFWWEMVMMKMPPTPPSGTIPSLISHF